MTVGTVWFVGAGPGDPELITVKGRSLIERAGAILFAGSLVNEAVTRWAPPGCTIADSKDMTLEQMAAWLIAQAQQHAVVIRLQTGDPALYGALIEVVQPLDAAGVPVRVVPGVSSAMASAAAAVESFTLPEVTQSVIFTRVEGRTPMPEGESLAELARHHCTLCIFLSITLLVGIVIGGLASISGAIFGALFIQFVPNWAQDISKAAPWAIYGVFMILVMYVMPHGIAGAVRRLLVRLARRRPVPVPAGAPAAGPVRDVR